MNTTQLECFTTVADTLSFARAAEQLNVSQPTVTHQIKSLEAEMGCSLFHRTTRRVRLTEQGQVFLPEAEAILSAMRRAQDRFRANITNNPTRLAIGCRSFTHAIELGDIFREMAPHYTDLRPDVIVIPRDHLHQLLEDGELDMVLDFAEMGHRGEAYRELARVSIGCICLTSDELAARASVTVGELAGRRLAFVRPGRATAQMLEVSQRLVNVSDPSKHFLADSIESAITLAEAGLALTVQPTLSVPPDPQLACVPLSDAGPISFGAYTWGEPNPGTSPATCQFLSLLAQRFAEHSRRER